MSNKSNDFMYMYCQHSEMFKGKHDNIWWTVLLKEEGNGFSDTNILDSTRGT